MKNSYGPMLGLQNLWDEPSHQEGSNPDLDLQQAGIKIK
jgi:hypothetical protein